MNNPPDEIRDLAEISELTVKKTSFDQLLAQLATNNKVSTNC
jgi:hypothetical protein